MFIFNKFTDYANTALNEAIAIASRLGHTFVGSEHLLYGLVINENSLSSVLLSKKGVSRKDVYNKLISHNGQGEGLRLTPEHFTPRLKKIMDYSILQAQKLKHKQIATEHLLLSILELQDGYAILFLQELGVDIDKLYTDILDGLMKVSKSINSSSFLDKSEKNMQIKTLLKYGKNLNELAKKGKLDPVLERDDEIKSLIKTLSRRTKNNPCLIGEAGVGKTAIVEGLAMLIENGMTSDTLKDKIIIAVDISNVIAGAKYRGDFEERIQNIIEEAVQNKNIILFIDEIHNIVGTGSSEGAMDCANILKPYLSRGEIQLIGATTYEEYERNIAKDLALDRRLCKIEVLPPNKKTTKIILNGIKHKYEEYHHIKISDEVIDYAINCADRYLKDRFFPDKAIDLIDEAGANLKVFSKKSDQENKINLLQKKKENALLHRDFDKLSKISKSEKLLLSQNHNFKGNDILYKEMKKTDIANVIAQWTKIPIDKIKKSDTEKLLQLENKLKESIIGQDNAISIITKAVKRGRVLLNDSKRPIGSFLFLGTTGVGKTKLCKELAKNLFGNEDDMIRIDMSEYMEKHSVSKLIGSPAGYVGYDDGGFLTKMVRRKPYSIILFDEIEKAHNDVLSILLQILDDGRLTDSFGKTADFSNAIIIMTSNVGAKQAQKNSLGFINLDKTDKENIMKNELKKYFRPELLNRIDNVIVFNSLNLQDTINIAKIYINQIKDKLREKRILLSVEDDVIEKICIQSNYITYGARDLKREILKEIEYPIVDILLNNENKKIEKISFTNKKIDISFQDDKVLLLN